MAARISRALPLRAAAWLVVSTGILGAAAGGVSGIASCFAVLPEPPRLMPPAVVSPRRPSWWHGPSGSSKQQRQRRRCEETLLPSLLSSLSPIDVPSSSSSGGATEASPEAALFRARTSVRMTLPEASRAIDDLLLPKSDYGSRLNAGRDAQGLREGGRGDGAALAAQDPRLAYTYGEFPLASLDVLLDVAERSCTLVVGTRHGRRRAATRRFVDVGSRCGRLCLYVALTRPHWEVAGIERAPLLHDQAVHAARRAVDAGYLQALGTEEGDGLVKSDMTPTDDEASSATVGFHCAVAQDAASILEKADVVFAYSTTWQTCGFSTETSSMVLSDEWQRLFTDCCRPGCVVVTTDRSLDASASTPSASPTSSSSLSWKMLAQVPVDNPEVGGSVGYIQQRME